MILLAALLQVEDITGASQYSVSFQRFPVVQANLIANNPRLHWSTLLQYDSRQTRSFEKLEYTCCAAVESNVKGLKMREVSGAGLGTASSCRFLLRGCGRWAGGLLEQERPHGEARVRCFLSQLLYACLWE